LNDNSPFLGRSDVLNPVVLHKLSGPTVEIALGKSLLFRNDHALDRGFVGFN